MNNTAQIQYFSLFGRSDILNHNYASENMKINLRSKSNQNSNECSGKSSEQQSPKLRANQGVISANSNSITTTPKRTAISINTSQNNSNHCQQNTTTSQAYLSSPFTPTTPKRSNSMHDYSTHHNSNPGSTSNKLQKSPYKLKQNFSPPSNNNSNTKNHIIPSSSPLSYLPLPGSPISPRTLASISKPQNNNTNSSNIHNLPTTNNHNFAASSSQPSSNSHSKQNIYSNVNNSSTSLLQPLPINTSPQGQSMNIARTPSPPQPPAPPSTIAQNLHSGNSSKNNSSLISSPKSQPSQRICHGCNLPIVKSKSVTALGNLYHFDCFVCYVCHKQLSLKFYPFSIYVDGESGVKKKIKVPVCDVHYKGSSSHDNVHSHSHHYSLENNSNPIISATTVPVVPVSGLPLGNSNSNLNSNINSNVNNVSDNQMISPSSSVSSSKVCKGCGTSITSSKDLFVSKTNNNSVADELWHINCHKCHTLWNISLVNTKFPNKAELSSKIYNCLSLYEETTVQYLISMWKLPTSDLGNLVLIDSTSSGYPVKECLLTLANLVWKIKPLFTALEDINPSVIFSSNNNSKKSLMDEKPSLLVSKIFTYLNMILACANSSSSAQFSESIAAKVAPLIINIAGYLKALIQEGLAFALNDLSLKNIAKFFTGLSIAQTIPNDSASKCTSFSSLERFTLMYPISATDECASCQKHIPQENCIAFKPPGNSKNNEWRWHMNCFKCNGCAQSIIPNPTIQFENNSKKEIFEVLKKVTCNPTLGKIYCQNCTSSLERSFRQKQQQKVPGSANSLFKEIQHGLVFVGAMDHMIYICCIGINRIAYVLGQKSNDVTMRQNTQHYSNNNQVIHVNPFTEREVISSAPISSTKADSYFDLNHNKENTKDGLSNMLGIKSFDGNNKKLMLDDIRKIIASKSTNNGEVDVVMPNSSLSNPTGTMAVSNATKLVGSTNSRNNSVETTSGPSSNSSSKKPSAGAIHNFGNSNNVSINVKRIERSSNTWYYSDLSEEENSVLRCVVIVLLERYSRTNFQDNGKLFTTLKLQSLLSNSLAGTTNSIAASGKNKPAQQQQSTFFSKFFKKNNETSNPLSPPVNETYSSISGAMPGDSSSQYKLFGEPLASLVISRGVVVDPKFTVDNASHNVKIPDFVRDCIDALMTKDMSVQGIFRKNGNIRGLKELTQQLNSSPSSQSVDLLKENQVQLAALMKKFLREMPEPLFTFKLHEFFIATAKSKDLKMIQYLLAMLPKCNRDLLEVLCKFFKHVGTFSGDITKATDNVGSKMNTENLAKVIAPNVLYKKPSNNDALLATAAASMGGPTASNADGEALVSSTAAAVAASSDFGNDFVSNIDILHLLIDHCEELFRIPQEVLKPCSAVAKTFYGDSYVDMFTTEEDTNNALNINVFLSNSESLGDVETKEVIKIADDLV